MALLRPRYLSGTPQRQWIVLCLFLLFALMVQGSSRSIQAPSDLVPVQVNNVHLLSEGLSSPSCNPGDREGKGHIQCNCTFGPGCSFVAVISETAAAVASFKLPPIQVRTLPLVSSEAVSHFRPPRSLASA